VELDMLMADAERVSLETPVMHKEGGVAALLPETSRGARHITLANVRRGPEGGLDRGVCRCVGQGAREVGRGA
jgi:hypothetical protein